jgi:CRP/FNR family transcriptional regulator, anaerobic regulatory protein
MLLTEAPAPSRLTQVLGPAVASPPCAACRVESLNFCCALQQVAGGQQRNIAARHNIYRVGEASEGVQVVCDGWAVRFIQLPNGKRQILSVIMPGDLIGAAAIFERQLPFSVQAVTRVRYRTFPSAEVRARLRDNPTLFDLWLTLAAAEHHEADRRLVDLGQRTAQERIVSLIVDIMLRSDARGDCHDDEFAFPMSQQQMADFTGLTPVHTCRVLSALRKAGLCDVGHGTIKVLDRAELQRIAAIR